MHGIYIKIKKKCFSDSTVSGMVVNWKVTCALNRLEY
jgi:hypothetical protein